MFLIISILSDDIFIKITKASKICNQFQIKWFDCLHLSNPSYELIIIQSEDGALKLVAHPTGLFTVSVCMMSNYSKSRVLSLQLLARLCDDAKVSGHRQVKWHLSWKEFSFEYNKTPKIGQNQNTLHASFLFIYKVSDAMSMLRLRFGEPVRFKFLVGMLNSYNSSTFQVSTDYINQKIY